MMNQQRSEQLITVGIILGALAACFAGAVGARAGTQGGRPNFLVIVTDDQRWDALGVVQREQGEAARFPFFETPNLDRLAASGTRFRNAFVVNSLCSPSRAAMLTGQYHGRNGIASNDRPFPEDAPTYPGLLREAGYRTGYVGKWHMGRQSGKRPGFDESASFVGQGRYQDCPFEVDGEATPTEGWVDDVSTDFAIDFLDRRTDDDRPFLLVVGYKTPHGPRTAESVPPRLADRFADATARPPVSANDVPPWQPDRRPGPPPTEEWVDLPEGTRVYFQLLAGIDEVVGRLLDALDRHGLAEDTVVFFTSDNGYYLGEHGQGDKRTAYEESLRVPLLVRDPGAPAGRVEDRMVLNIDLAPTILGRAGLPVPDAVQGRGYGPLLRDEAPSDWRTEFFYEYLQEQQYKHPWTQALRAEDAKLVRYPEHPDWQQQFDLPSDPHELNNLLKGGAEPPDPLRRRFEAAREAAGPRP